MELKFLGRGAAFNPLEGNTSAYFIEGRELFLIDCGETVFESIMRKGLLEDIDKVNVMITHTHSDHIGSLGSLALYCYYNLSSINIIMKDGAKHIKNIDNILESVGCPKNRYNYVSEEDLDFKYKSFKTIRYTETIHCSELDCYSLIFETDDGVVYFSGDTRELDTLKKLIKKKVDKIFIDVSSKDFEGNPHVFIGDLNIIVPDSYRSRVNCMHFNDKKCIDLALKYGFNVIKKSD